MAEQEPPEPEFKAAVETWRKQHGLREDDPVLLLVDLFRIHLHHRDKLHCQDGTGHEGSESLPALIGAALANIEKKADILIQENTRITRDAKQQDLESWVAALAVILGAFGGFILGRFWP